MMAPLGGASGAATRVPDITIITITPATPAVIMEVMIPAVEAATAEMLAVAIIEPSGNGRSVLRIRPFQTEDEATVIDLWRRCGLVRPNNDPHKDILRKAKVRPDLFLVGLLEGRIVAAVMAGYEGHRGWINYLAVSPDRQKQGFGRQIMAEAERLLRAEGCPKINLQVRTANAEVLAFYRAIGFVVDEVVSLGKRLEPDEPPRA